MAKVASSRCRCHAAGVAIVLACAASQAAAQDFRNIAPKPLPPASNGAPAIVPPQSRISAAADPKQVVLPELKGLRLVASAHVLARAAIAGGIAIENLPLLDSPELRARLMPFLGKPATFGDLQAIAQRVVAWYRDHGHPFVDVTFPEQDVTAGVVQALVTEFHLGKLRAEGNRWFSSKQLLGQVRLIPGEVIDYPRLAEDIAWLNQNPFRRVSLVAEKSATPGDTDLVLKTEDELPLRLYAGYDNTGTAVLSYDRWNLGGNWGNAFGLDQQLSYQLTTSDDFWNNPGKASFVAHSLNYVVPLPWRDKLNVFGAYSRVMPLLGPDFGLVGINGQASLRYVVILSNPPVAGLLAGMASVSQDLQIGYDFKTSNNNLNFGGEQVSDVTTEVDQFSLTYDANLSGDYGQTSLSNILVWSPGNLTPGNRDILFRQQANTPYATSRYVYDTITIVQSSPLPLDTSWVIKLVAQTSNTDLLPSEQLGAGGHDSVRGYDERAANGSLGFLVSQELRTPPLSLLQGWQPGGMADQAQFLIFWDYGSVRDARYNPGNPSGVKLSSIGLGFRYTLGRLADMRFDYGWQQRALPGAADPGGIAHFGLTLSY